MRSEVNIRLVQEHYVLDGVEISDSSYIGPSPRLPQDAEKWWNQWALDDPADVGCVATHQRQLVGFVRILLGDSWLSAAGTWVDPDHRRSGLALKMWKKVLRRYTSFRMLDICVIPSTEEGHILVESLQRKFPQYSWIID